MIGRTIAAAAAALAAATGAAACCAPPLLIGLLGLSSAGMGGVLEPYRPLFLGASAAAFGLGFVWVRRSPADGCPDRTCDACRARGRAQGILWVALGLAIAIAFYPTWMRWL